MYMMTCWMTSFTSDFDVYRVSMTDDIFYRCFQGLDTFQNAKIKQKMQLKFPKSVTIFMG